MAYHQTGLEGSGTANDPFLIKSYSDWEIIDATRDIGDPAPHYKLISDINMNLIRRKWNGASFFGGYLDMDGHTITAPVIAVNSYLMHSCKIIGGPMEVIGPNGKTRIAGGESKILNVKGTHVQPLLEDCSLQRIYLEIDADGMSVDDETRALTGDFKAEQCYISVHNDGFQTPLIGCEETFVDTCFEFTGQAYDTSFIIGEGLVLDHCMVRGDIDCSEMRYSYMSTNSYMVTGTVSSCAFDILAKGATLEQGWAGYATETDKSNGPTIATERAGLYVYNRTEHEHGAPVTVISPTNFKKPDYLISIGFDVKKLK